MEGNSNENKETQAKPYVIANPVEGPAASAQPSAAVDPYSPVTGKSSVLNADSASSTESAGPAVDQYSPVSGKSSVLNPDSSSSSSNTSTSSTSSNSSSDGASTAPTVRYNPVTGEEMNMSDSNGNEADPGAVDNTEKLKTIEVDYQPASTANTVMLVFFFVFLILFVVFLPNIQSLIAEYKAGGEEQKEIVTGTLVCELTSSTINLDTNYERRFSFTEKKLKSAKFSTVIRGNESMDGDELSALNNKCQQIKSNVDNLSGVNVSCTYENGKITEVESFDYASYNPEQVVAAYVEAGTDLAEFTLDQDIDDVRTLMSRSGFSCKVIDSGSSK